MTRKRRSGLLTKDLPYTLRGLLAWPGIVRRCRVTASQECLCCASNTAYGINNPVGPRIAARKHRIAHGGGAWRFMGGPANAPGKYRRALAEKGILHADGVFSTANMSVWKATT